MQSEILKFLQNQNIQYTVLQILFSKILINYIKKTQNLNQNNKKILKIKTLYNTTNLYANKQKDFRLRNSALSIIYKN